MAKKKEVEVADIINDTTTYYLFDEKTQKHEYDIKVKNMKSRNTVYELLYSNSSHWQEHVIGKVALSIVDNNQGIIINGLTEELGYDVQHELRLLLTFMEKSCANMINYTVLKEDVHMTL